MTELYIEKHDPVERAKRQKMRAPGHLQVPGPVLSNAVSMPVRSLLPAAIKHQVILKHNGQCAHTDGQGRIMGTIVGQHI